MVALWMTQNKPIHFQQIEKKHLPKLLSIDCLRQEEKIARSKIQMLKQDQKCRRREHWRKHIVTKINQHQQRMNTLLRTLLTKRSDKKRELKQFLSEIGSERQERCYLGPTSRCNFFFLSTFQCSRTLRWPYSFQSNITSHLHQSNRIDYIYYG